MGLSSYLKPAMAEGSYTVHLVEIWLGVAIGAITFTGSIIAWAKLGGRISGKPLLLPGRNLLNLAVLIGVVGLSIPFVQESHALHGQEAALLSGTAFKLLLLMTFLACFLGALCTALVVLHETDDPKNTMQKKTTHKKRR